MKITMLHPQFSARGEERSVSPLFVNDLCAQLVPLNRYGPNGLATVIASGLRAVTGASRMALCAVAGCDRH